MNRRELLKAAMVGTVNGRVSFRAFAETTPTKYIVFYSPMMMGPDFGKKFMTENPGSVAYPVEVPKFGDIDNAIRLFKQE